MPLPVVPNLYLCRLIWSNPLAPRQAVNDLFFHDDAGGHDGTDIYNAIDTNVTTNMWLMQSNGSAVATVKTTKLDGSAATIDHATSSPAKWKGGTTATGLILGGASVLTIRTGFRGRSRRGRIFLPWVDEAQQADGTLAAGSVATAGTAWTTFKTAMKTAGFPLHVCSRLHDDSIEAVSVTYQPYLKSQRRRNRR